MDKVKIIPGDITEQAVDAIVSILPKNLEYRGELNAKIAQIAGADMDAFIQNNIFAPRVGDIYAMPAFNLPSKHIFFIIMPVFKTEFDLNEKHLLNACRKAMEQARDMRLLNMAFPPIASGKHGFPKVKAARLILQGIEDRIESAYNMHTLEEIRIVARTEETCRIFRDRIVQMGG